MGRFNSVLAKTVKILIFIYSIVASVVLWIPTFIIIYPGYNTVKNIIGFALNIVLCFVYIMVYAWVSEWRHSISLFVVTIVGVSTSVLFANNIKFQQDVLVGIGSISLYALMILSCHLIIRRNLRIRNLAN